MTLRGRRFISMIAISLSTSYKNDFIFDFGHFPHDLYEWYCLYQGTYSDTEKYWSVWYQTYWNATDANNNLKSEGLDIHYRTCSYTNDDVCLSLQTCRYSIIFTCQTSQGNQTKAEFFTRQVYKNLEFWTLSLQGILMFLSKRNWKSRSCIAKIICRCLLCCVQRVDARAVCIFFS